MAATSDFPPLEVILDPGDSPPELIAEFYVALSEYYRACGGSGLRVVKTEETDV